MTEWCSFTSEDGNGFGDQEMEEFGSHTAGGGTFSSISYKPPSYGLPSFGHNWQGPERRRTNSVPRLLLSGIHAVYTGHNDARVCRWILSGFSSGLHTVNINRDGLPPRVVSWSCLWRWLSIQAGIFGERQQGQYNILSRRSVVGLASHHVPELNLVHWFLCLSTSH